MAPDPLAPWTAVLGSAALDEGRALLERWAEPHRRYHDPRHLAEVLAALHLLAPEPPTATVLAAYWHDAVYDPRAADNEVRSAELAEAALARLGVDRTLRREVRRLVLLTTGHDPAPGDDDGALLCDADLAVLAADEGRYLAYARDVREEYAHVGDDDFRTGRSAVLRQLVALPHLFGTPDGRARWEDAARRNVEAELARLSGDGAGAARRP